MPANNRKALVLRFPGAIRKPDDPDLQRNNSSTSADEIRKPDTALPFAEAKFRQCTEQRWSHDAWRAWFAWCKSVSNMRGGDYFADSQSIDPRYVVDWLGEDSPLGVILGSFTRTAALRILQEFNLDDAINGFDSFWETIFACLMFPRLTPGALKRDSEIYGHFQLDERLEECKVLLRQKGLLR